MQGVLARVARAPRFRNGPIVAGLICCLALAVAPRAMANCSSSCTWTGQTATSGNPAATNWSTSTNWSGGNNPTAGANGTLSFPSLSSCPSGDACYSSNNDLTGATVSGISIDDGSGYNVTGNGITLGAGGISATTSGFTSTLWSPAILLSANQSWSLNGGALDLESAVTGATDTLGIGLSNSAILGMSGDNELGPVTVTGSGSGDRVIFYSGGSLDGTDGNAVDLTDAELSTIDGLSLGPLTMTGASMTLEGTSGGTPQTPVASVNGAASVDSNSSLAMSILPSASAPSAGSNYSQLSASGNVTVGGDLELEEFGGTCSNLTLGNVYTLVQSTGGSLNGTFSNAAEGAILPVTCGGSGSDSSTVEIHYTPTSVTATAVTATATALQASPSNPDTNQAVALTATVTPTSGSSTPSGTVAFENNGAAIAGCTTQPVDSSGQASCEPSFTAASSPESLTAVYTPGAGANFGPSTSSAQGLVVSPDGTGTGLSASNSSPQPDQNVTYTATVTPSDAGPAEPSGAVAFDDGGSPIAACSAQPLTAGSSSSTATCTVSYSSTGSHSITATYAGDSNFNGSASSAQSVVVQPLPPPPANTSPPAVSGTAQVGQTLTANDGGWTSSPTSYSYQWEDCDSSGNNCTAIPGATSPSYTLTGSDAGHTVRVLITAINAGGSAQELSPPTGVVAPASPADLSISTSSATSRSGRIVDPGITLSCPAGGSSCSAMEHATVMIGGPNTPANSKSSRAEHPRDVGGAQWTVSAGSSSDVTFRLNQLGQTLLLDHKHLRLLVKVTGEQPGAAPVTASKSILLSGRFAHYTVSAIKVHGSGTVSLRVKVSAPGQVDVLVTAWKTNLAMAARLLNPALGRFVVARATATAKAPGVITFRLRPNVKGGRLIAHPPYPVTLRLWVSYIPLYAFQADTGKYGLRVPH